MRNTSIITALITAAALAFPFATVADDEDAAAPSPLTEVWVVVPKAGMEEQFRQAVIDDNAYRVEAGDPRSWQAYTVALGHNMQPVMFRACCFDWADQDAYEATSEEKELGKFWNENVHQYVDHYHHYLDRTDWEHSQWPEGEGDGPYYGVTSWSVKQGGGPASGEARRKISKLLKDEGWEGNWLWMWQIGGKPTMSIVTSYANYADMAPNDPSAFDFIEEKLGEEEAAALFAAFSSGYTGSEYTVWKRHEAMSMEDDD